MRRPLLIFGARIFAEEIADLAADSGIEVAGLVENLDRDHPRERGGIPVYWFDDIQDMAATHDVLCALGTVERHAYIAQAEALGFRFRALVHPSALISPSAHVGDGAIVSRGAILGAHVRIGRHTIVNRGAMIGHHTEVGDVCTVGPGANIAGMGRIGDRVWIGMSAALVDRIAVGEGAHIAAGALVTKNVEAGRSVAGSPARAIGQRRSRPDP